MSDSIKSIKVTLAKGEQKNYFHCLLMFALCLIMNLILFTCAVLSFSKFSSAMETTTVTDENTPKNDPTIYKSQIFEGPKRELGLIIKDEGIYPQSFTVYTGELVTLYLTALTKEKTCFVLPEKKIYVGLGPGELSGTQFIFETPGVYQFHCPVGKLKGQIHVLETTPYVSNQERNPQSVLKQVREAEKKKEKRKKYLAYFDHSTLDTWIPGEKENNEMIR